MKSLNSEPLTQGRKLYEVLMRNDVTFRGLREVLPRLRRFMEEVAMTDEAMEEAEIQIKYKGYIERENSLPRSSTDWKTYGFRPISTFSR